MLLLSMLFNAVVHAAQILATQCRIYRIRYCGCI